jgi:hypothetical protein
VSLHLGAPRGSTPAEKAGSPSPPPLDRAFDLFERGRATILKP